MIYTRSQFHRFTTVLRFMFMCKIWLIRLRIIWRD